MEFNGVGGVNRIRGLDLMKSLFGYMCANSNVCVNVNVFTYFVDSKNTLVNEILSMVPDYYRQGSDLQIPNQL